MGAPFSYTVPEATDPDNDAITYSASLTGGSELPEWLQFTSASRAFTGTPQVCDAPATLPITITATDDGPIPQSATADFRLTVTGTLPWHQTVSREDYARYAEENNAEPPFDEHYNRPPLFLEGDSTTRSLQENRPKGTPVGDPILACDPDGDGLLYKYLFDPDSEAFSLDPVTGQLTTKLDAASYDYESVKKSYAFKVIVEEQRTDLSRYLSEIAVTVNLTDDPLATEVASANRAPAFDANIATFLMLPENSPAGTKVGGPISATDPDADPLTYSLTGDDAASFEIGSGTGQITTKAGETYDYETKRRYSMGVTVDDGNGGRIRTYLQVSLTNVNEAPAFASASATREVAENSVGGVNVGSPITATDPDNDTLTYSLTGTDASSFAIGASTGQITTKSGETYDYEAKASYSLTVNASDGDGLSDSIDVTVNLTDVGTPVTACFTDLGALTATAEYAGKWDAADCKAHHQDSRARYFQFTPSVQTEVSISLTVGTLYVSKGSDPNNGWGTAPKETYEHRREVRSDNGKLVHNGGTTATLTLAAGTTYTVEAAGASGDFTVTIAPH